MIRCKATQCGYRALLALIALALAAVALAAIPTREIRSLFELSQAGDSALRLPSDVAVGRDGRVYVVDSGNQRIAVFDRGGRFIKTFGRAGQAAGELLNPVGIAVGPDGHVHVAERGNRRVQTFSADGAPLRSFAVMSRGQAITPIDVAVDATGRTLYVTGNNNHRIMAFSPEGKLQREWGGEGTNRGEFRYPATIAVGANGTVYAVDVLNTRVQAFAPDGGVYTAGDWGVLPGQLVRPKGVAVDRAGQIFVSDSYLDVVQLYNSSYQFVAVLGSGGKPQRLPAAAGIALDGNRLYVAEMLRHRVSVFEIVP